MDPRRLCGGHGSEHCFMTLNLETLSRLSTLCEFLLCEDMVMRCQEDFKQRLRTEGLIEQGFFRLDQKLLEKKNTSMIVAINIIFVNLEVWGPQLHKVLNLCHTRHHFLWRNMSEALPPVRVNMTSKESTFWGVMGNKRIACKIRGNRWGLTCYNSITDFSWMFCLYFFAEFLFYMYEIEHIICHVLTHHLFYNFLSFNVLGASQRK